MLAVIPNFLPVAALALVLAGSACRPEQNVVSVCEVIAAPEQFSGKSILVSGTILPSMHGIGLIDSRCPGAQIAFGSRASSSTPLDNFHKAYFANYGPSGHAITATVGGVFVYVPAIWPVRRLDNYRVVAFRATTAKRPQ